jgi:hypothetical protein
MKRNFGIREFAPYVIQNGTMLIVILREVGAINANACTSIEFG